MTLPAILRDLIDPAATLIAVLLGALLTYLSTWFIERRKEHEQRRERAWSLFFTVQDMTNDLVLLDLNVRKSISQAEANGVDGEVWSKIADIVGFSKSEKHIPVEQLVVLAATKNASLIMRVREIESAHQIYIQVAYRIAELREKLETFDLESSVDGSVVGFEADDSQMLKIAPLLIRLKGLGDALLAGLPSAACEAKRTAQELGPHLKAHYKFKHFSTVTFPSDLNN